ncbi:transglycosylase [Staphylococcus sp. Marseille-Q1834]|uniref:aggregation-promoting factor C-terminal-like domain-containing protein n=1 Tax=Staphylococcus sp. Marseille-Q1834 TaxID=2866594 RepID=UPI0012B81912|nr:transglycosylase [Staphylococcus sp. Marseille-Q1834]
MKKTIFALMTMVSLGGAGIESGQAHASELTSTQSQQQNYEYNQSSSSSASTSSVNTSSESTQSVYEQFIAAGGTEALWESIVLPESGGNPNASNGQYHGLGQTNQSWGYGSVETQTKGMIQYAKERYGSIEATISFRQANGWW